MKNTIGIFVFGFLILAVHSTVAGDWNSLSRISKNRTVKVRLKTGQQVDGKIRQVGPESMQLMPEVNTLKLMVSELSEPVEKAHVGQLVQIRTSGGLAMTGTLRKMDDRHIWLQIQDTVQIDRAEIRRITCRSHWIGALIGFGIGAGAGAAIDKKHDFDIPAALGALAGGIIGIRRTIYNSAPMDKTEAGPSMDARWRQK